ncbi:uncharacterized protein LOC124275125 isoform X1 [Haliotis rubra]|uniref:uncharacterized protein LOC124275125 isoform X1 n=1 Tax=Haliotis rubra TaxID=36100 RepID=UPI001EE5E504|nr:uncharacterized protein LOC124275125 isoform X1 [Haliotis rubra]
MCTHLCVLLCVIASVQRGTAQGGARPSDSVLLTSVTSLKNEGTELKGVSGAIKDALYFDVHVSGDSVLTTMLYSLRTMGHDLLVEAENVRYYAEKAISELEGQAPSYSAIQQDMVDTVSEAGVFKLQINSFKAAMQDFINKAKSRGHSNDALMSELNKIAGYFHELLVQTAAVVTHAQGIASQLQGGKVVG